MAATSHSAGLTIGAWVQFENTWGPAFYILDQKDEEVIMVNVYRAIDSLEQEVFLVLFLLSFPSLILTLL